jgi:Ca2+-binding RTX toxin-like protein
MPYGTSETLEAITIAGVPEGAFLSAGTDNGDGTWTVTPDHLSGLTLTPPLDWSGSIALSVTATSSDGSEITQDLNANIAPVADFPTLTITDVVVQVGELPVPGDVIDGTHKDDVLYGGEGDDVIDGGAGDDVIYGDMQDQSLGDRDDKDDDRKDDGKDDDGKYDIGGKDDDGTTLNGGVLPLTVVPLDVNAALTDMDGSEALSIEISGVPLDSTLSLGADNGDGTWTLTGEDLSKLPSLSMTLPEGTPAEDFALTVSATSTETTTGEFSTATGVLDVTFESTTSTTGGDDQLFGGQGDDTIYAGGGADVLDGGQGDDKLFGGQGDDTLVGGQGDDSLYGGDGNDVIDAGQGDDYIEAGLGDDVLSGGQGDDTFVFHAGDGNDVILDFGKQDELRFEGPEFSAEDFSLQTNGDDTATITFGGDSNVSVTLNDFNADPSNGYTVTQDDNAVVVTFTDHSGGKGD